PGPCVPFQLFVCVPETSRLVIRKSAPSKNERREKAAAGWDRKALIKNRGKKKDKNKDHGRRPQTRHRMRQKSWVSKNAVEELRNLRSLDTVTAGPSFLIVFMELPYPRVESDNQRS